MMTIYPGNPYPPGLFLGWQRHMVALQDGYVRLSGSFA